MGGTRQPEVAINFDEYYVKLCHYCGEEHEEHSLDAEYPAESMALAMRTAIQIEI